MRRSTQIVVLLGIAVQIAAFLRTTIIAAALGTSPIVDAYNLGLIAPTFISAVIGSWLQLSFIGRYVSLITANEAVLAAAYRSRMLKLVLSCALFFAVLCFSAPELLMALFIPADQSAMIVASAAALKLAGLVLIPVIVGDYLALVLNCHGHFFAAALAPLINALASVLGMWLWPSLDLMALVWTLLIGSLCQILVIIAALAAMPLKFTFKTDAASGEVRTAMVLGLPLLPAMMLGNATAAIIQFRAAQVGEGVVATYGYASRLHGALAQVLIIGLSTVLLPHFAALWSRGDKAGITMLFRRLARCTILVVAYATVGIFLMGETATEILFQRGAFSAQQTLEVSWLWALLSLSLFPQAFGTFIAKFCQAVRDARSLLATGIISFVTAWIVTWFGASVANMDIVISAVAVSFLATCCYWIFWLSKRVEIMPIMLDIAMAILRIGLILIPAVGIERWCSLYTNGLPDMLALVIRGLLFSLATVSVLLATRSHRWFLA
jgi:putative peptidoglycan lipid II flippase